jgi:four helix bundle protein
MNSMDKSFNRKDNLIVKLTFQFALKIIELVEILEESRKYAIANQLIKSGTSIGANVKEAQSPESKDDFVHKMKIAAKEAEETEYWLELCHYSKRYPDCSILLEDILYIKRVLSKIISSSKVGRS